MDTCTTTRPSTATGCRGGRRTLAQTSPYPGAEPGSLRSWRANGVRTAAAIKPKSRRRSARLQIRPARGRGLSGRRLEHLGRGQLRIPAASNSPVGPQPARGIGSTSDLTQAVLRTKQLERHPARSSPALGKAIDVKTTGNGSTEAHLRKLTRRRRGPLSVARAQVAPTHNRAVVADGAGHRARGRGQSNEPAGRNGEHSTGIGTPAKQCAVSLNTTRVLIGRGEVAEARACGWHRRAPVVMSPTDGAAVGKETARMGDARGHFDKMVQRRGRGAIANAVGLTVVPDAAQHASGRRDGLERKDRHTDRRKCGAPAQHGPVGKLSADGGLRGDEVLEVRSRWSTAPPPAGPGGPCGPTRPCGPCGPASPGGPGGPGSPGAPGSPRSPCGPAGPGSPCMATAPRHRPFASITSTPPTVTLRGWMSWPVTSAAQSAAAARGTSWSRFRGSSSSPPSSTVRLM